MPLTSSDEDDARWELANQRFGPLCPECFGRVGDESVCPHCCAELIYYGEED